MILKKENHYIMLILKMGVFRENDTENNNNIRTHWRIISCNLSCLYLLAVYSYGCQRLEG